MATNFFERFSTMAQAAGPKLRAALPTLGVALLVAAGAWTYVAFFDEAPETYGQLVVDSPEIYTRERLVNDRFVEDAWLRRKLRATDKADFTPTGSLASRDSSSMRLALAAEAGDAEGGVPALAPRDVARRDATALFRSELTYRSDIRNLIIENQLDDRHDLRGNSLYRLKFDASVLPGDNTRANALISVTLEEPPHQRLAENDLLFTAFDPDELKRWRTLFAEWLRDIDDNINQVVTDLKYDYETHRLPKEYLHDFFVTMQRCDDYDQEFYEIEAKPLIDEGDDTDPRIIRAYIETLREGLSGCNASTAGTTRLSGAIAEAKGAEPAAGTIAIRAEQDDLDAADSGDPAAATKLVSQTRRKVKRGETKKGKVSVNEMINRFAAPRLFQLIFGRGTAGGEASGNLGVWNFFGDYAELLALYLEDDNAFQLRPKQTIFSAYPTDPTSDDPCKGTGVLIPWRQGEYRLPWVGDPGFCLSITSGTMEAFFESVNMTPSALSNVLAGHRDYRKALDAMIGQQGKPFPIVLESGLFFFIRDLQRSDSVFSYAVTPKQAVQSLIVDDQTSRDGAVAGAGGGLSGQLGGDRGMAYSGVREQPLVVGYGNALGGSGRQDGAKIEFGWFISPTVQGADHGRLRKAHNAAQYALTALVSVPAWWDEIDLRVELAWVEPDGSKHPVTSPDESGATEDAAVTIDLPRDLESISASLFDRSAGPEVEEAKMEPIVLTVCRRASVLLPGRRLWRSAVVTVGAQSADEIQVLPNMRGIIAKFDRIDMPSGWSGTGEPYQVPVTVWTSEGSRTLRNRARIDMPLLSANADTGVVDVAASGGILTPSGTCRTEPRNG